MEEYKGLTVSELIMILKRFPGNARIGTAHYDSEDSCMYTSNSVSISKFDDTADEVIGLSEEKCDYYIW
ncbi:MAG: hypothetical protein ACRC18_06565 [Cetobacterium sp.]